MDFAKLKKMLDPGSVVREGEMSADPAQALDPGSVAREGEMSADQLRKMMSLDAEAPDIAPEEADRRRKILEMGMNSAGMAGSIGGAAAPQMFAKLRGLFTKTAPQAEGAIGKGLQEMAGQMKAKQLADITKKVDMNRSIKEADQIGKELGLGAKPTIDRAEILRKIEGASTDDAVNAARQKMLDKVQKNKATSTEEPTQVLDNALMDDFAAFMKKSQK